MATREAELRAAFLEAYEELCHALDAVSDGELARGTANEGWTARDTLSHLSTIQPRYRVQLRCALDGTPFNASEDIDTYNNRMVAERRGWNAAQLRAEIEREYAETLALIDGLRPGDLARTFEHPRRGTMSVEAILAGIPQHLNSHLQDVVAERPRG